MLRASAEARKAEIDARASALAASFYTQEHEKLSKQQKDALQREFRTLSEESRYLKSFLNT